MTFPFHVDDGVSSPPRYTGKWSLEDCDVIGVDGMVRKYRSKKKEAEEEEPVPDDPTAGYVGGKKRPKEETKEERRERVQESIKKRKIQAAKRDANLQVKKGSQRRIDDYFLF